MYSKLFLQSGCRLQTNFNLNSFFGQSFIIASYCLTRSFPLLSISPSPFSLLWHQQQIFFNLWITLCKRNTHNFDETLLNHLPLWSNFSVNIVLSTIPYLVLSFCSNKTFVLQKKTNWMTNNAWLLRVGRRSSQPGVGVGIFMGNKEVGIIFDKLGCIQQSIFKILLAMLLLCRGIQPD